MNKVINYMPYITFYNMGFGDSFLINGLERKLLVDCGSKNIDSIEWIKIKHRIFLDSFNEKVDLLITHYHQDHISKIRELNNLGIKFDNIYIRSLDVYSITFTVINVFFELSNYAHRTGDYNTLFYWLSPLLFSNLLKSGGNVIGVNNVINNRVSIGGLTARVLWPSPNIDLKSKLKIDVLDLLKGYKNTYSYLSSLISFYKNIFSDRNIINEARISSFIIESESELNDTTKKMILEEISLIIKDKTLKLAIDRMHNLENYLSIVFDIGDRLIMCGDATKSVMNRIYKSMSYTKYRIVKVPHHGTPSYFINKFYSSDSILLIPNSKIFGKWSIDNRYTTGNHTCECLNSSFDTSCKSCNCCISKKNTFKIFAL